jgi:4-carboxymuconolactone decarboxylase
VKPTTTARLEPLRADAIDPASFRGRLPAADRYLTGASDAPPLPGILGLLAHHPTLGGNWLTFSAGLLDAPTLDPRDRELLVLRVAARTGCRYEWAQHARMGLAAGLSAEQIDALAGPLAGAGWADGDVDLVAAADQLIDEHRVGDVTWKRLAARFEERQLLELLFVVGSYLCLALVLNSAGLEPDPGSET